MLFIDVYKILHHATCMCIYIYDCTYPYPRDEQISPFPQVPRSPGPNGWSVIRKLVQKPAGYFLGQGVSVHQKRRGALNLWKYSAICMLIIGNTPQYCWLNYFNDSLLILNTPAICMLSVRCIVFIPAMTIAIIVKCLTTRRSISKQICWIHRWATANLQHLVDNGLSEIGYHQIRLPCGDIRYTPLYTIVRHSQKIPPFFQ